MKSTICTILVGIVFVVAVGLSIQNYQRGQKITTLKALIFDRIPTKRELQRQLQTLGYYKSEIDGDWGRQSNKAWDLAIGDQSALVYYNPATYRSK